MFGEEEKKKKSEKSESDKSESFRYDKGLSSM